MGTERQIPSQVPSRFESRSVGARETEEQQMRGILREYESRLGKFEMLPVGDAGWILQSTDHIPRAYPRIVFNVDVDDTLLQSSAVKQVRKERYWEYMREQNLGGHPEITDDLMDHTYKIAQNLIGQGSYLTDNHVQLIAWVTDQLVRGEDLPTVQQRVTEIERTERLPGGFSVSDRRLAIDPQPDAATDLQEMFGQTLRETELFDRTVDTVAHIGQRRETDRLGLNLFSLGIPPEQLVKICELLVRRQDLIVDQMWITKAPKDVFLRTMIEIGVQKQFKRSYADGEDRNDGYAFGAHPHVVVDLDDSISSLESKMRLVPFLTENTGAKVLPVRVRNNGTKDGEQDWDANQERDFRNLPDDVTTISIADELISQAQHVFK